MSSRREQRIAYNESAFRSLNERLEESVVRRRAPSDLAGFVCECGNADCDATVRLDVATYERIRSSSQLFFVLPGHETLDAERVVERGEGFLVVHKHEDVADITEATDPRS